MSRLVCGIASPILLVLVCLVTSGVRLVEASAIRPPDRWQLHVHYAFDDADSIPLAAARIVRANRIVVGLSPTYR